MTARDDLRTWVFSDLAAHIRSRYPGTAVAYDAQSFTSEEEKLVWIEGQKLPRLEPWNGTITALAALSHALNHLSYGEAALSNASDSYALVFWISVIPTILGSMIESADNLTVRMGKGRPPMLDKGKVDYYRSLLKAVRQSPPLKALRTDFAHSAHIGGWLGNNRPYYEALALAGEDGSSAVPVRLNYDATQRATMLMVLDATIQHFRRELDSFLGLLLTDAQASRT
jgi:hypothetical protein